MPLPTSNPDLYERKSGGGFIALFGLPFLLAGIGIVVASFLVHFGQLKGNIPLFFGVPFGMIFATVGSVLVFGRTGLIVDKQSGEVIKWWGLLKPMRKKAYLLSDCQNVRITKEVRQSKDSSYTVYPVRIHLADDEKINVEEPRSEDKARKASEEIAKVLQVDIIDESTGEQIVRSHDELDLSIKERFDVGSLSAEMTTAPENMKSIIDYQDSRLVVEIPPPGFQLSLCIGVAAIIGFCSFAYFGFFEHIIESDSSDRIPPIFATGFIVLFLALPGLSLLSILVKMFLARQTLVVSNESVQFTRGWLIKKTANLPANEIEEVIASSLNTQSGRTGKSTAIMIRTDMRTIRVGGYLPPQEVSYLIGLIQGVLVA